MVHLGILARGKIFFSYIDLIDILKGIGSMSQLASEEKIFFLIRIHAYRHPDISFHKSFTVSPAGTGRSLGICFAFSRAAPSLVAAECESPAQRLSYFLTTRCRVWSTSRNSLNL